MNRLRITLSMLAAALTVTVAGGARAQCLPPDEARNVVASGQALPMSQVARAAREAVEGEVIGGRLCDGGGGYVYQITVLTPDGRAARVSVDASSGAVLGIR